MLLHDTRSFHVNRVFSRHVIQTGRRHPEGTCTATTLCMLQHNQVIVAQNGELSAAITGQTEKNI